ncbi:hypothetical protein L1987_16509 [Smallanthus sonchifolius]|uniref:Uncharacterized protein n=1 Tax=Smallanthus sonchifolius TaxID=185202 RepID=A0ACB9J8F2_9ASTR|nr:hypothetical protein L1987_16509 [Smallanthus sonchifolius]
MGELNHFNSTKRKNGLDIDWGMLLDDASDDHPPELVIMPSEKSKRRGQTEAEYVDYQTKTDTELKNMISKHKSYIINLGHKFKDNGEKLKATVRRCEAELKRRIKIHGDKVFNCHFLSRLFEIDISIYVRDGLKCEETIQLSDQSDDGEVLIVVSRCRKDERSLALSKFAIEKEETMIYMTPAPDQDQPLTKLKPKLPSSYHLVDEDIEDPFVLNTTLYAEKLSDCMKDVKVYFPSSDDRYPVEVIYTDMECLAPEACLSSTIINFYIQEDSFLKFRKWWKGVNIFEKAYILVPVHQSAHWSLGIICIPTKEDELGPIVLHLDSLGLHDSTLIFDKIRRFLKEEWTYLRNSEVPLDLPITDEIWENLDHRIINRKMEVPQQRNAYDCGLFVLYYMERFIKEAPERLTDRDLSMFGKQWFRPEEASNLRVRIHNLLVQEFKIAKDKEAILSPKC